MPVTQTKIYCGDTPITKIYLGTVQVDKSYLDSTSLLSAISFLLQENTDFVLNENADKVALDEPSNA